jgi:hypothetical protein
MERWIGSCRRELLDPTLVWNQRHLMIVLPEKCFIASWVNFPGRHEPWVDRA